MTSDQELVAATLRGDMSAAAELIRRYESAVFATAFGISSNHHAAEDVAQDTFVTAINSLKSLRNTERFGGWLLTIARRKAIRGNKLRTRVSLLESLSEVPDVSESSCEWNVPEDIDLMKQVAELPEHERAVVALKHFQGHSIKEIADITGRPTGTITKQLSRAYERLRKHFKEKEK